jgi:lipopolysaccharide transport system permease protein
MWQLFIRDFKSQYQQSVLGVLWSVILPLIPVLVYVFMTAVGVLLPGDTGLPYALFVVVGITIWRIFSDGIMASMHSLMGSRAILGKTRIPKIALILPRMAAVLFDSMIRAGLIVVLAIAYQATPSPAGVALALAALAPLFCLTMAIGMFAALFNIVVRDVHRVIDAGLTYAMFLSSVIFAMPESGLIGGLNLLNPMNTYVNGIRDLLFVGALDKPVVFLATSLCSVVFLLVVGRLFYVLEHVIDDKL